MLPTLNCLARVLPATAEQGIASVQRDLQNTYTSHQQLLRARSCTRFHKDHWLQQSPASSLETRLPSPQ